MVMMAKAMMPEVTQHSQNKTKKKAWLDLKVTLLPVPQWRSSFQKRGMTSVVWKRFGYKSGMRQTAEICKA